METRSRDSCGLDQQDASLTVPSRTPAFVPGFVALLFFATLLVSLVRAQDNYEIQVYSYETVEPRATMLEIHSNFTVEGSKTVQDGMLPTNHTEHETLEITQGINNWSEVGFYLFSSIQPDDGWQWVGDHIRPRCAFLLNGIGRWA